MGSVARTKILTGDIMLYYIAPVKTLNNINYVGPESGGGNVPALFNERHSPGFFTFMGAIMKAAEYQASNRYEYKGKLSKS